MTRKTENRIALVCGIVLGLIVMTGVILALISDSKEHQGQVKGVSTMLATSTTAAIVLSDLPLASASSSQVLNVLNLINAERANQNLAPLVENGRLDRAAQAKVEEEIAQGYFAHISPTGRQYTNFVAEEGYRPYCPGNVICLGENLAVDFPSTQSTVAGWMNSTGHRANILGDTYKETGIGYATGTFEGHTAVCIAQFFAAVQ